VPAGRGDLSVQDTTDSCPRKINSLLYLTIPHLLTQIAPLGRGLIMVKEIHFEKEKFSNTGIFAPL